MTIYNAIGLMSGTSMDGVDIALIKTDGEGFVELTPHQFTKAYDSDFRENLSKFVKQKQEFPADLQKKIEKQLTEFHVQAVNSLLESHNLTAKDIDIIGFHGHTIEHRPWEGISWQIGNGELLAQKTGIDVVCNFRSEDLTFGGQGAPLVPVFHKALLESASDVELPSAVLNIGGVSNVTYVGNENLIAFDAGPGVALLDDWIKKHTGKPYDEDGCVSASGVADKEWVLKFLKDDFFKEHPPKSLDRDHFQRYVPNHLGLEDGAATLALMTVEAIARAKHQMPKQHNAWYVCGGGRLHKIIMKWLNETLQTAVYPVEYIDGAEHMNGDALEAQAFAYLAVRSKLGLPITFSSTTGIKKSSVTGGVFYPA